VPLFLKLPGGGPGRLVEEHVRIRDVLPTIADALGARSHGRGGAIALARGSRAPRPSGWKIFGAARRDAGGARRVARAPARALRRGRLGRVRRRRRRGAARATGGGAGRDLGGDARAVARLDPGSRRSTRREAAPALARPPLAGHPVAARRDALRSAEGERLFVAVNGRVAGVARAYQAEDDRPSASPFSSRPRPSGQGETRSLSMRRRGRARSPRACARSRPA
jgi:hypothetical protein